MADTWMARNPIVPAGRGMDTVPAHVTPLSAYDPQYDPLVAPNPGRGRDYWKVKIEADGATDVHVLENIIAPGGTFGWHSHPGPSLVIVKAGTLSVYHAEDCTTPEDFGPASPNGSTFVDQGHDLHMVRNNSTTDIADVYVVSFVPAGFGRRIDEPNPNPSICPN